MSIKNSRNYLYYLILAFSLIGSFWSLNHIHVQAEQEDFYIINGVLEEYRGQSDTVVIPETVKTIGSFAFSFSQAKEVIIPDSVTKIEEWAFFYMPNLKNLEISSNVIKIEEGAFLAFSGFSHFTVDKRNPYYTTDSKGQMILSIDKSILYAYPGAKDQVIDLPKELKRIGNMVFYSNKRMTGILLPDKITEIGNYAFAYSTINDITLPSKLQAIELGGFCYCDKLTEIVLPKTLNSIGNYAFSDCYNLQTVKFLGGKPPKIEDLSYQSTTLFSYTLTVVVPKGSKKNYQQFVNSYESGNEMVIEEGTIDCYASSNIITILRQPGYEYSINGISYSKSNVFDNLEADTKYLVYIRKMATDNNKAGKPITKLIRTKKDNTTIFYNNVEL